MRILCLQAIYVFPEMQFLAAYQMPHSAKVCVSVCVRVCVWIYAVEMHFKWIKFPKQSNNSSAACCSNMLLAPHKLATQQQQH